MWSSSDWTPRAGISQRRFYASSRRSLIALSHFCVLLVYVALFTGLLELRHDAFECLQLTIPLPKKHDRVREARALRTQSENQVVPVT